MKTQKEAAASLTDTTANKFNTHKDNTSLPENQTFEVIISENTQLSTEVAFPIDVFPKVLRDFAVNVSETYGTPIEFGAMAALTAISASLQKKIQLFDGRFYNYPQLWVMIVAPTGTGKTEPMNLAFSPLQAIEKVSFDAYQIEYSKWQIEASECRSNKQPEPDKPIFKQSLIDDSTPEALYETLSNNDESLTLFRDELSGWFADFGRYGKSGEISRYLSIFNNGQFTINRKQDRPRLISKPFLSILGSIQPKVLHDVLNSNNMKESGFSSRFLYVAPQQIERPKYTESEPDKEIIDRYNELINQTHALKIDYCLTLSVEAKELFKAYYDDLAYLCNSSTDEFLKGGYAKLDIHCLRVALIIAFVRGIYDENELNTGQISPESMQVAIDISRYFQSTLKRVGEMTDSSKPIGKGDLIKAVNNKFGIKNKQMFADSIGVSRPYISQLCNE